MNKQYLTYLLNIWLALNIALPLSSFADPAEHNRFSFVDGSLYLPAVATDTAILQANLTRLTELDFHFRVDQLINVNTEIAALANYDSVQQIVHMNNVESIYEAGHIAHFDVDMQYIPASNPLRFMLLNAYTPTGQLAYSKGLGMQNGLLRITDQSIFEQLALRNDLAGFTGVQELKILLADIDSEYPVLYLQNSINVPLHANFAIDVLGWYPDLTKASAVAAFNAATYFSNKRQNIAASIVYHEHYQKDVESAVQGLFTLEFWPTDPVSFDLIQKTYHMVSAALPISQAKLVYHPASDTQELLYQAHQQSFQDAHIPVLLSEQLFAQSNAAVLNTGEAYGRLRVIDSADTLATAKDIVIYTYIPNNLSHVAGIITDTTQTPLSHINLKARQNNTPNAYIKNASTDPAIAPLINQWVHYQVSNSGFVLEAATQAQAEAWLVSVRPAQIQIPESDLSVIQPRPLTAVAFSDWTAFGVKAANVAELGRIMDPGVAPEGYAIPFYFYDQYMNLARCGEDLRALCEADEIGLSFYQQVQTLLTDTDFQNDPEIRAERLKALRKDIEKGQAPQAMIASLETIRTFWEPAGPPFTQSLRTRSSTNNEDLPGFNGAGLYKSYTHKQDEGELIKSIKQVWASLWTERAYDERDFHRIDHFQTYMGVLVHPNYGDEQANGVAVSKNIFNPDWEGFYINAQYGEISITNPEPIETANGLITAIPDEFIITRIPAPDFILDWETQFIRHSNVETVYDLPVPTENVLTDQEMVHLRDALQTLQKHFKALYQGSNDFAMEIEFKITETDDGSRGVLAIKQARPWID